MKTTEFTKTDSEEIGDVLLILEKSLDIKFDDYELIDVKTYGELSDRILRKLIKHTKKTAPHNKPFIN